MGNTLHSIFASDFFMKSNIEQRVGVWLAVPFPGGAGITVPTYTAYVVVFTPSIQKPVCSLYDRNPDPSYYQDWRPTFTDAFPLGRTLDGVQTYAFQDEVGSIVDWNPQEWADVILRDGDTPQGWISRHTKKNLDQLLRDFSVDFDLYRYNELLEIKWKGSDSFGYGAGKYFNGTNTTIEFDVQEVNTLEPLLPKPRYNWTTLNYDDNRLKFTFQTLMERASTSWTLIDSLITNGLENFGIENPFLSYNVFVRAKTSNGDFETNWVKFNIKPNGEATVTPDGEGMGGEGSIKPDGTTPEGADDTPTSKNDTSNITNEGDPAITGASVLTTSYALTPAQVKTFGNFLWDDNFLDNVALLTLSPSENVVSCKLFPCSFTGTDSALKVGNVIVPLGEGVFAKKLEGTNKANNVIQYGWKKVLPEGATPTFIDYSGTVLVYLPFIGYKEIPLEICMNKFLRIQYNIDIVSGECQVTLYTSSSNSADLTTNYGTPFVKYSGSIAVDIPLTSSNRSNIESAMLQNVMGAGASAVMGNAGGVLSNAGGFVNNALFGQVHYETKGVPTPSCELLDKFIPFLVYIRPHYQNTDNFRSNYGHSIGYKCNNVYTIGSLKGFTKVYDFDTDGIKGTEEEKQELKRIMESGFIA